YDYVCDGCDHKFELLQSIKDNPIKKCPECKKSKLRRLFGTGAAIIFKGSGFYQTDYRSEGYKKSAEADKNASAPPAIPETKSSGDSGSSSSTSSSTPKKESKAKK
ncbi:MAG: FmdB family zinc ribbon protein, partial [Pirellulales bacterium]